MGQYLFPLTEGLFDRLLPDSARRRRARRRLYEQVAALVINNVENLRWAIYQSIDRTFVGFGTLLDQRLANIVAATQGAIEATLDRRLNHAETVAQEVARLGTAASELELFQRRISGG